MPSEGADVGRLVHQTITVQGVVQGVGFRPFIHGLASRLGLQGTVRNDSADAVIEVEGREDYLRSFIKNLVAQAPPINPLAPACHVQRRIGTPLPEQSNVLQGRRCRLAVP
ncbi:MAG: hypothetical protein HOP00_05910, partial [Nitrospira sp.]|nr:hypothetical protein [Nitrospira sp.]